MVSWFTAMSVRERRTFWACFTGWALDAMDVQLYALAMPTLIVLWGMSKAQAGMLGTVALLFSSVGGWIAGILADRYGRTTVLKLTIVWFAVFTCLSGFTQSFEQLLVTRSLQGLGFGGEWAAGAVLMSEVIDKRYRGRAVGSVQSGWSIGYGAAVLLFTLMFSIAPPELAWRYLFFLGLIPGLFVVWIQRNVQEPEIFREVRAAPANSGLKFLEIFGPSLRRHTLLASLLAAGALGGNYVTLTWLATYLNTVRHLSVLGTGGFLGINICGSFLGYVISAHLSDLLGRRKTFVISCRWATRRCCCSAFRSGSVSRASSLAWAPSLRNYFRPGCAPAGRDFRITPAAPSVPLFRQWWALQQPALAWARPWGRWPRARMCSY